MKKKAKPIRMWALKYRDKLTGSVHPRATDVRTLYCDDAVNWEGAETYSEAWKEAKKRGYRVVRVIASEE